jgi:chromosome segregation ATPase
MHGKFNKNGQAEVTRLTEKIKALESQMAAEIAKKDKEIADLEVEKGQMKDQLEKERMANNDLADQVKGLNLKLFNLTQSMISIDAEGKNNQVGLEEKVAKLQGEKDVLAQDVTQLKEAMEAKVGQVDSKGKEEIARLNAIVEQKESQLVEVKGKFEDLSKIIKEKTDKIPVKLEKVENDAKEQIAKFSAEAQSAKAEAQSAKAEANELRTLLEAVKTQKLETGGPVAAGNVVFDETLAKMLDDMQKMLLAEQTRHTTEIGTVQKGLINARQEMINLAKMRSDLLAENEKLNLMLKEKMEKLKKLAVKIEELRDDAKGLSD